MSIESSCKCGVLWSAMLYGEKCAKCGEQKPFAWSGVAVSSNAGELSNDDILKSFEEMKETLAKQKANEVEHEEILKEVANILIAKGVKQVTNDLVDYLYQHVKSRREPVKNIEPFAPMHSVFKYLKESEVNYP